MYLVLDANVVANVAQDNTHVTHDVSLSIKYQKVYFTTDESYKHQKVYFTTDESYKLLLL